MLGAIMAGINMAAPILGSYLQYEGQKQTNAANAAQAQKQMDFQERMRSTQYQTQVEDIKKAGLNPALAYGAGGAGNVSGASATMQNPAANMGNNATQAAQNMLSLAQTKAAIAKTQAETSSIYGQLQINRETAASTIALNNMIKLLRGMDAEGRKIEVGQLRERLAAEYNNILAQTRSTRANAQGVEYENSGLRREADVNNSMYGALRPFINDATSIARMARGAKGLIP